MNQLKRSVICAREFSQRLLGAPDVPEQERIRAVLRLNERIYKKCLRDRPFKKIYLDHGVDPFDAVFLDERLPGQFLEKRHPQMLSQLEEGRKRSRALRERRRTRKTTP